MKRLSRIIFIMLFMFTALIPIKANSQESEFLQVDVKDKVIRVKINKNLTGLDFGSNTSLQFNSSDIKLNEDVKLYVNEDESDAKDYIKFNRDNGLEIHIPANSENKIYEFFIEYTDYELQNDLLVQIQSRYAIISDKVVEKLDKIEIIVPFAKENENDKDQEVDDQEVDDQEVDDQEVEDQEVDDQEVEDQGVDDQEVDDQEVEDQEVEDQEVDDQEVDDQEVEDEEVDDQEVDDQEVEDQETEDQKVESEEAKDQEVEDQDEELIEMIEDSSSISRDPDSELGVLGESLDPVTKSENEEKYLPSTGVSNFNYIFALSLIFGGSLIKKKK